MTSIRKSMYSRGPIHTARLAHVPDGWPKCSDERARRSLSTTTAGSARSDRRFARGMFSQSTQGRRRVVRVTCDRVVGHNDSIGRLGRCARRGSSNLTRPTLPSPSASRLVMAGLRDVVESSARAAPRPRSGCTNCMAVDSARERELPRSLSKCGWSSSARQKRDKDLSFLPVRERG